MSGPHQLLKLLANPTSDEQQKLSQNAKTVSEKLSTPLAAHI